MSAHALITTWEMFKYDEMSHEIISYSYWNESNVQAKLGWLLLPIIWTNTDIVY